MSEEDSELERLKAKRLAEMQKNISTKEETESTPKTTKEIISENPRDSIIKVLGFRGLEVLENAESQFPNETKMIVQKLMLNKMENLSPSLINSVIHHLAIVMSNGFSFRNWNKKL